MRAARAHTPSCRKDIGVKRIAHSSPSKTPPRSHRVDSVSRHRHQISKEVLASRVRLHVFSRFMHTDILVSNQTVRRET